MTDLRNASRAARHESRAGQLLHKVLLASVPQLSWQPGNVSWSVAHGAMANGTAWQFQASAAGNLRVLVETPLRVSWHQLRGTQNSAATIAQKLSARYYHERSVGRPVGEDPEVKTAEIFRFHRCQRRHTHWETGRKNFPHGLQLFRSASRRMYYYRRQVRNRHSGN